MLWNYTVSLSQFCKFYFSWSTSAPPPKYQYTRKYILLVSSGHKNNAHSSEACEMTNSLESTLVTELYLRDSTLTWASGLFSPVISTQQWPKITITSKRMAYSKCTGFFPLQIHQQTWNKKNKNCNYFFSNAHIPSSGNTSGLYKQKIKLRSLNCIPR